VQRHPAHDAGDDDEERMFGWYMNEEQEVALREDINATNADGNGEVSCCCILRPSRQHTRTAD